MLMPHSRHNNMRRRSYFLKTIGLLFSFVRLLTLFGSVQWKLGEGATVPLRHLKDPRVLMGSLFLAWSNASSYGRNIPPLPLHKVR